MHEGPSAVSTMQEGPSAVSTMQEGPSAVSTMHPAPSARCRRDLAPSARCRRDPAPSARCRRDPAPSVRCRRDPAPSARCRIEDWRSKTGRSLHFWYYCWVFRSRAIPNVTLRCALLVAESSLLSWRFIPVFFLSSLSCPLLHTFIIVRARAKHSFHSIHSIHASSRMQTHSHSTHHWLIPQTYAIIPLHKGIWIVDTLSKCVSVFFRFFFRGGGGWGGGGGGGGGLDAAGRQKKIKKRKGNQSYLQFVA